MVEMILLINLPRAHVCSIDKGAFDLVKIVGVAEWKKNPNFIYLKSNNYLLQTEIFLNLFNSCM
jgi:hypothetical protein